MVEDENGFISWRMMFGMPFIMHFVVYPDKRKNAYAGFDLYSKFKEEISRRGHDLFLAEVLPGKERFKPFIKYYHGYKYSEVDGKEYYIMQVR
jgi:hypothetical protein